MRRRALCPSEHDEQCAVLAWAALMETQHPELAVLFAIPNGARTSWTEAKRLRREGLKAGVPDLCLPVPRRGFHGCWIELKRLTGGQLSPAQRAWHAALRSHGHYVVVCQGATHAIHQLTRYLSAQVDDLAAERREP